MAFKRSGVRFPSAPSVRQAAWAPVAQLDRASDFGSEGREFESLRAHLVEAVGYQSGQMEQTVNLPAYAYVGSNPTPTMRMDEGGGMRA
jgi:hypothetical protein